MKKVIIILSVGLLIFSGCQSTKNTNSTTVNKTEISQNNHRNNEINQSKTSSEKETNKLEKNFIEEFKKKHSDLQIMYSVSEDINNDGNLDNFIVSGKIDPKTWYINNKGDEKLVLETKGDYSKALLLRRDKQKHFALICTYPPSNSKIWIFNMKDNQPNQVFTFVADWDIRVNGSGIDTVWKQYKSEGGYELIVDKYLWDAEKEQYIKQGTVKNQDDNKKVELEYKIVSIKAYIYDENSKTFSQDIIGKRLFNQLNPIKVIVEVTGKPGKCNENLAIKLTSTRVYSPTSKKTTSETKKVDTIGNDGKSLFEFWLKDTGTAPLKLNAKILGQDLKSEMNKTIDFEFGE